MIVVVKNPNDFALGFHGKYFPKQDTTEIELNLDTLRDLNNHSQLEAQEVRDYNPDQYTLNELRTIACAEGIEGLSSYKKDELIKELTGEEKEGDI